MPDSPDASSTLGISTTVIESADGHRFDLLCAGDRAGKPLIFIPALGVDAKYYRRFASSLADAGFHACVVELRGRASSSVQPVRGADYGYVDILERDLPAVFDHVREVSDEEPLVAGHSLGGQLALLSAARYGADRAAIVASGLPYHGAWDGIGSARMYAVSYVVDAVGKLVGVFPGDKVGFGARDSVRLMGDWTRTVRSGDYDIIGSDVDWDAELRAFDRPALALRMKGDHWAPERSVDLLMEKLRNADIVRVTLAPEAAGHPHFAWVNDHGEVVSQLARFAGT